MLPITALVQLNFETCRGEICARMTCADMYTAYAVNKFIRTKAKASGHTMSIIS